VRGSSNGEEWTDCKYKVGWKMSSSIDDGSCPKACPALAGRWW
jgi:hypothetical protein